MGLVLNQEQQILRDTARRFVAAGAPLDRARTIADGVENSGRERLAHMAKMGWLEMAMPLLGGDRKAAREASINMAVVCAEMARYLQAEPIVAVSLAISAIANYGTESLREKLTPRLINGDEVAIWCFPEVENNSASDPSVILTRDKTGATLNGTLYLVDFLMQGDYYIATAIDDEKKKVQVVIRASDRGVSIEALETLDITRRYARIHLYEVRVPQECILRTGGTAATVMDEEIAIATALQCVEMVAATSEIFASTLRYLPMRKTFGRSVSSYQAIKHRLANCYMHLEAAKAVTANAVESATQENETGIAAYTAKIYASPRCSEIVEECLQFHGAIGFTWEHDIHLYLRRIRMNASTYGDLAWQRRALLAQLRLRNGSAEMIGDGRR